MSEPTAAGSSVTALNVGPVIFAVAINSMLTGVCFMQYSNYWTSKYKDNLIIKLLVPWCAFVDLFQFVSALSMLWNYAITNFGNLRTDLLAPFGFLATPVVTAASSCPIQIFLAYRIFQLTKNKIYFATLSILAVTQAGFAIGCSACFLRQTDATEFGVCLPVASAWLGLAVAVDLAITILLFSFLSSSRTGFQNTNSLISRLIFRSVETAAIVTAFCIADLLTFALIKGSGIHLAFQFPIGRIYAATLMLTLNSRRRDATDHSFTSDSDKNRTAANRNGGTNTQVNVSVHREIQMDDVESRHSVDRKENF